MKRKIFSILFALVLVVSFSLIPAMPVSADLDTVVKVDPASQEVIQGGSFQVDIYIENIVDMKGVEATLNFDPGAMQAIEITEGDFLTSLGGSTIPFESIDNMAGKVECTYVLLGLVGLVTGSGVLATIEFEADASASGTFDLTLTEVILPTAEGFEVPSTEDGTVTISAPAPAPSQVWVDDDYCDVCDNDGHTWGYDAFATIQDGIDAVAGSTINVAAGTYNEEVTIDKALTLNGANAGIPGYDTRGAESIVDADDPDSGDNQRYGFRIESGDVTIDGFKIIDADEATHLSCDAQSCGDKENVVIKNNYIDTTEAQPASWAASTGIVYMNWVPVVCDSYVSIDGAVVQDNYIIQKHQKSAIWLQDVEGSITIKGNKIDGNPCDNGIILGATSALGFYIDLSGTVIEDNDVDGCDYGIQLKRVTTSSSPVSITGNNITGGGTGFRLWSIGSETVIQGNEITNNTKGFELGRSADYPVNNVSILGNDILDNAIGIRIGNGGLGTGNEAHFNNIDGNGTGVQNNDDTATFDAENNWWGHASGPTHSGNPGGGGDEVSDNVYYDPWLGEGYAPMKEGGTATGTGTGSFSPDSGALENLTAVDEDTLPTEGKPDLVFPHGFFSFNITGLSPGQTVTVTITLPSAVPIGTEYWKYHIPEGWIQIPMGDDDGDNVVTITLVDGGLGDDDGTANGVIIDQGGPGSPPPPIVGGTVLPVDKVSILMPWIGMAVALALAGVFIARFARRKVRG